MAEALPHHDEIRVPTALLIAAGIMIALVIGFVALSRATGIGQQQPMAYEAAETLSVRFVDEADGGVGVYAADDGQPVHIYAPETGGFVRTALRSMALERKREAVSPEVPFTLVRTVTGRFILEDPATDNTVLLNAFADGNAESFAVIFDPETETP